MPRGQRIPFKPAPYVTIKSEKVQTLARNKRGRLQEVPEPLWVGDWLNVPFEGLPWSIEVKGAFVNGVWQIVGLKIEAGGAITDLTGDSPRLEYEPGPGEIDPTITTDLLRQLPLRQLRSVAENYYKGDNALEPFTTERPVGGWGDEHYRAVAETYRNAANAPTKAVADRWSVTRPAASKWIKEARRRELLGYPSRRGVAGASESTSPVKPKKGAQRQRRASDGKS